MSEGSGHGPEDHPGPARDPVDAASAVPPPGNSRMWQDLVQRFAPAVWRTAREYGLDPGEAAEVSQTTWLRLVEHLPGTQNPDLIGDWLLATARRESIRLLRLHGRPVRQVIDLAVLPEPVDERPDVSRERGDHPQ